MATKIAAISAFVLIFCSVSLAQITEMRTSYSDSVPSDSLSATTTPTKWQKDASNPYKKILGYEIINDGAAGASLYYAFNDDTTDAKRFILTNTSSSSESDRNTNVYLNHIYVWSKSGTVAYRMKIW